MPERFVIDADGRLLEVEAGTSVAAALWNAGILGLRRSLGGELRAPLCAMGVCFECRVTIDGRPNRRACLERCSPGMQVRTDG